MREIRLANLDKTRPVLVLTRDQVRPYMTSVTVAPITSTIKGLSTEVPLDQRNGLDDACVVSCDNIRTVPSKSLGRLIGYFYADQEPQLTACIKAAFSLI
ncbi:type II toxin-antitoxin system PemK/MazF family toxin [Nocardia harenae]|uniref:type II toxin-antitoxin system PemK/MazF family toxin n=1 Tax=Nocardia harenae TaxID=358707 RepID=UPI0008355A43|nr:type II toxin-antitoxin system PemK/MazF family toxin [Nocardia harenae]